MIRGYTMKYTYAVVALLALSLSTACSANKTAGESVDDSWIHTKTKSALVGYGSSDINIEVYQGVVQLAGFLTNQEHKDKAVKAAQGIKGVVSVSDQLHVVAGGRSAGETLDDGTTTTKAKAALVDDSMASINVEVNRGVVLLSGFVKSDDVRTKAVDLVKGVTGVKSVLNGMDLKP
jgi:osmotically-inducible protein OsmY